MPRAGQWDADGESRSKGHKKDDQGDRTVLKWFMVVAVQLGKFNLNNQGVRH